MQKHAADIQKSGKLAEKFCRETFGIKEGELYEIKASSLRQNRVFVRAHQVMQSLGKLYVVVRFSRKRRKRKTSREKEIVEESLESAFKKNLDVFTIRGVDLLEVVVREKFSLRKTNVEQEGAWAYYWFVPLRFFPQDVLRNGDRIRVFGDPSDPPEFLRDDGLPF